MATVQEFAPLTPVTPRDERVPHSDQACILTTSAAGKQIIVYEFTGSVPNVYDAVRLRLGRLYPSFKQTEIDSAITRNPAKVDVAKVRLILKTKQDEINLVKPPEFDVIFEDSGAQTVRVSHASILSNQQNGWARPEAKLPIIIVENLSGDKFAIAKDCTLMSLQTLQIKSGQLTGINAGALHKISLEFKVPAAATEVWLDTIDFVIN